MRWIASFLLLFLVGCAPAPAAVKSTTVVELHPYQTRTPLAATPSPSPAPSATLAASPTPFIYTIVAGDTFNSLARRYKVSLDALLAANPGLAPETLSVGQKVNIPADGQAFGTPIVSTPAPLEFEPARCAPSGGGLYCFALARNSSSQPVENVQARIALLGPNGQALETKDAFLPLDILAAGQALPVYAFFAGQSGPARAEVTLTGAVQISAADQRYQRGEVHNLLAEIAWDGLSAALRGKIQLAPGAQPATRVWLAVIAYDAGGQVAGWWRWEAPGGLSTDGQMDFSLVVYSLGPMIARVDVQVEALQEQKQP